MSIINFGINDAGINYEVALEKLGQGRQVLMGAIREERAKQKPSPAFIKFCEKRLQAIDELQDELNPEDSDLVEMILQREAPIFRV